MLGSMGKRSQWKHVVLYLTGCRSSPIAQLDRIVPEVLRCFGGTLNEASGAGLACLI